MNLDETLDVLLNSQKSMITLENVKDSHNNSIYEILVAVLIRNSVKKKNRVFHPNS